MNRCNICKRELDVPGVPESKDCGGDCLHCMAYIALDPDAREALGLSRDDGTDNERD